MASSLDSNDESDDRTEHQRQSGPVALTLDHFLYCFPKFRPCLPFNV